MGPLGGTQYKIPYGNVPPTWVAKSASLYMNDTYNTLIKSPMKCKVWYVNWPIFQNYMNGSIFQSFPKIKPKLAQIKKKMQKSGDFAQIWRKIDPIGI